MKTKKEMPPPPHFWAQAKVEYIWFCYVDLKDGQGLMWHKTDFREDSVENANKWRTRIEGADVFDKPTILVAETTTLRQLDNDTYATLSMSKEMRQKADLTEWSKRKCIFGIETRKLCTPSRYFDCQQCRR